MPQLLRFGALVLLLSASAGAAQAEKSTGYDARRDRLEGLSKAELAGLAPLLAEGPVVLVEFADTQADQLPAINLALKVAAPPELLTKVITDPSRYPRFMPTMSEVEILTKTADATVYEWAFDLALLKLRGRNTMTVFRAPKGRDAATRITIDSDEGDMGRGRFLMRVYPQGPAASLLVVSMRLDLRQANYVARQMAQAARSVNRSANLSLTMSMALNLRREAERAAGLPVQPAELRPLAKPQYDLRAMSSMLQRGDLLFFSMAGDKLSQVAAMGAVDAPQQKVHDAMRDANSFGSALVPGSKAKVVSQKDNVTTFDWTIDLPLVGVSGQMRMQDQPPLLAIDAMSGALKGGRWVFELAPIGPKATLVTGWARFDFSNSTWLLEKILEADPAFGVGMTGASEVMLVRAIRNRATK